MPLMKVEKWLQKGRGGTVARICRKRAHFDYLGSLGWGRGESERVWGLRERIPDDGYSQWPSGYID